MQGSAAVTTLERPEARLAGDSWRELETGGLQRLAVKVSEASLRHGRLARPLDIEKPRRQHSLELLPDHLGGLSPETVRDLLTDASERLPAYMEHGFTYTLDASQSDLLSDTGESLNRVLRQGLQAARQEATHGSRWQDELARRELEWQQHQAAIAFAKMNGDIKITSFSLDGGDQQRGWYGEEPLRAMIAQLDPTLDMRTLEDAKGRLDPNKVLGTQFEADGALWFISMTPMHVRESGKSLDGAYDPRRLKSLVRVVTPAQYDAEALAGRVRQTYDQKIQERCGGTWHGGRPRPEVTIENSLHFIMQHPRLIEQHLQRVREVLDNNMGDTAQLLDRLQYDFVAAIDNLLEGQEVTSLERAGDEARAAGKTYEGDCPTKKLSAEEQMRIMGLFRNKKPCCPFCNSPDIVVDPLDPVCGDKSCNNCGSEVVAGRAIQRQRHKVAKAAVTQAVAGLSKLRQWLSGKRAA